MEIRIKGLRLELSLLVPLAIMLVGYFGVGRFLRILSIYGAPGWLWLAIAALIPASIYFIPLSLGGLVGLIISLGLVFWQLGILAGLVAMVVASIVLWAGFTNTESPQQSLKFSLNLWQYLGIFGSIGLSITASLSFLHRIPGTTPTDLATIWQSLLVGAIAATFTILGFQIQAAELDLKPRNILLGAIALLGSTTGYIYTLLTYNIPSGT